MNAKTEVDRERAANQRTSPQPDAAHQARAHDGDARSARDSALAHAGERLSPDPLVQTDRYRLVTPYSLRW